MTRTELKMRIENLRSISHSAVNVAINKIGLKVVPLIMAEDFSLSEGIISFKGIQLIFLTFDFGLFVLSVIGNSIVIYVISRDKKLKNKSNYLILSVAVADLLIGLFGIPLGVTAGLTGAPHNFQLCLLLNSSLTAVFAVSLFSLVAVSFDRCWAVCYPVTYLVRGTATTKVIIALCWAFGIILGFLPMLGWNSDVSGDKCDVRVIADLNYLLFVCFIACLSTVAILVLYLRIYCAVIQQARIRKPMLAVIKTNGGKCDICEVRAANTLAMIVGTFFVLWTPGIINLFVISITANREYDINLLGIATILVHLNSAIDPLIYAYRMKNIRDAFKKLLTGCKPNSSDQEESSSSSDRRSSRISRTNTVRTIS